MGSALEICRGTALIRRPQPCDGVAVHDLISRCPPLDPNSLYCNLLQCSHFADTSALAEHAGEAVGFVSGYRFPHDPRRLFIWQVAVAPESRGAGLAKRMIRDILARHAGADVHFLHATITADNSGSWAMFASLARALGCGARKRPAFDAERHFAGRHASEYELIIGPFDLAHFQNFGK